MWLKRCIWKGVMKNPVRFLPHTSASFVPACAFDTRVGLSRHMREVWAESTDWLWIPALSILGFAIYRIRVSYIVRSVSAHFEERLNERTRIARDLHDRFLQTIQGSKMVTDDALAEGTDEERMRQALEKLSLWLGQAAIEGNAALRALDVSVRTQNHLAEEIERLLAEECRTRTVSAALTIVGDPREISPMVHDEILSIVKQAIQNSCMHSKVTQLHLELRYSHDLRLCLKDDGAGAGTNALDAGEIERAELGSMKARSSYIVASLTISSSRDAGTEVILQVPGEVAYVTGKKTMSDRLYTLFERARLAINPKGARRGRGGI